MRYAASWILYFALSVGFAVGGCQSASIPSGADFAVSADAAVADLVAIPPPDALGSSDLAVSSPPDVAWSRDLAVACPMVFPTFDRQCSMATDCVAVLHQIDCCGTYVALGIRGTEQSAFAAAEKDCESMYPGCGCAQRPTVAEDGTTDNGGAQLVARCAQGQCQSHFGP